MATEEVGVQVQVDVAGGPTLKSLKQDIKDARNEALRLSQQFGALSPQAVAATARVAELTDEVSDLNERIELSDPGKKFAAFGNAIAGVASGFTAVQGAMATFGAESEDLQKTLVKLQGAMALSEGLSGIADSWKDFQRLGSVIKTQVVAAFTTLRGAIIATGIGAAAVAIGLLVTHFEEVEIAIQKVFPAFEGFGKLFNKVKAIAMGVISGIIEQFKIVGEIMADVFTGDFKGAVKTAKEAGGRIGKAYVQGFDDEVSSQIEDAARDATAALVKSQENNLKVLRAAGATREKEADALELTIAQNKIKVLKDSTKSEREAQSAAFADLEALRVQQGIKEGTRLLDSLKQRQALQTQAVTDAGKDTIGLREKQLQAQLALEKKYGLDTKGTLDEINQARAADSKARFDKELKALKDAQDLESQAAEVSGKNVLHLKETQLNDQLALYEKYGYNLADLEKQQNEEALQRRQKLNEVLQKSVEDHDRTITITLKHGAEAAAQFATASADTIASKELEKQQAYKFTQDFVTNLADATQEASELEQGVAVAGALAVQFGEIAKQNAYQATETILETAGKILGKQTVAGKAVAVAGATINAIEGAAKSFTSLAAIPIVGPALGAVAAGAALVAGYARVKSILKVKIPGAADSASANLPAAPSQAVPSLTANTGALITQAAQQNTNLQQPQRVYVLESDITDTQERVAKIEQNAQF